MEDKLHKEMIDLRLNNQQETKKAELAKESKLRAQKTLTKAKKLEDKANIACDLSWTKLELICSKNDLDFNKTVEELDMRIIEINAEKENDKLTS